MVEQHVVTEYTPAEFAWAAWTAEQIAAETELVLVASAQIVADIKAVPSERRTFANTVFAYDRAGATLYSLSLILDLLMNVSTNADVRLAAQKGKELLDHALVDIGYDQELYAALKTYAAKGEVLAADEAKFLRDSLRDYKRNGLDLAPEVQTHVQARTKRLQELSNQFQTNINKAEEFVIVTPDQTAGLSASYLAGLKKDEQGNYMVTTAYPDYIPFVTYGAVAAKRKELVDLYFAKAGLENIDILKEAMGLRLQNARQLGYENHVAFETEIKTAKTAATVKEFLTSTTSGLKPLLQKELAELVALKQELDPTGDGKVHYWETAYLSNKLKERKYAFDTETLKEYFPLEHVLKSMLELYGEMFALVFEKLEGFPTWYEDVQVYAIRDSVNNNLLAYFTLDLHPREAKYGHAAEFPTIQARRIEWQASGTPVYVTPVASMVTNFPKSNADRPSLMPHDQVEVLFHEFGHVIHHCLAQTKFSAQSGTSVAQDFGEAPSQILEYWVWEPEVLQRITKHYRTGEAMPDELIQKLVATKNYGAGLFNARQMVHAIFDHRLYTEEGADPVGLFKGLWESILGIDIPEGQMYAAGFTHLMNPGYEGGYYGYMWSKVYAADMFSKFAEAGALSPQLGLNYRHKVLEMGSSRDELDSVRDFLGRDISSEAFLKELGI